MGRENISRIEANIQAATDPIRQFMRGDLDVTGLSKALRAGSDVYPNAFAEIAKQRILQHSKSVAISPSNK